MMPLAGRPAGCEPWPAPELVAWRGLAAAILVQALHDSRCTNGAKAAAAAGLPEGVTLAEDARAFLAGEGAAWLAVELGLTAEVLQAARPVRAIVHYHRVK